MAGQAVVRCVVELRRGVIGPEEVLRLEGREEAGGVRWYVAARPGLVGLPLRVVGPSVEVALEELIRAAAGWEVVVV